MTRQGGNPARWKEEKEGRGEDRAKGGSSGGGVIRVCVDCGRSRKSGIAKGDAKRVTHPPC